MRSQLDIFDHDAARVAAANRAAADHALHDMQFTKAERQSRATHYIGEAERWQRLAIGSVSKAPHDNLVGNDWAT